MRDRLLGVAEVIAWVAVGFTILLALRVTSIFLNLVDPAQCTDSCDAGPRALPIALLTFGLAWFPFVMVAFVRTARRGPELWWTPHAVVVALAHAGAMVLLIQTFSQVSDADVRTSVLASGSAFFDVATLAALMTGVALKRRNLSS